MLIYRSDFFIWLVFGSFCCCRAEVVCGLPWVCAVEPFTTSIFTGLDAYFFPSTKTPAGCISNAPSFTGSIIYVYFSSNDWVTFPLIILTLLDVEVLGPAKIEKSLISGGKN